MISFFKRRSTEKPRVSKNKDTAGPFIRKLQVIAGLLVSGLALVIAVIIVDRIVMPIYTRHGSRVKVPDFRYLRVSEADSICKEVGLILNRARERIDDRFPEESVLDQHPMAGSITKPGRVIDLTVSVKDQLVLCPDVIGRSPREAKLMITTTGLTFPDSSVRYATSYHYPKGVVMDQNPTPMIGMLRGDTVIVTVSTGTPVKVNVPDLVGMKLERVKRVLSNKQLRLGDVVIQLSETFSPGVVISQKPVAGTVTHRWSSVNCVVSIAPAEVGEEQIIKDQ